MIMALIITSIVATIISSISLAVGVYCAVELISFKKSTHTVQYVDPSIEKANQEFIDAQKDIEKYNTEYSKELKEEMPMFHQDENELKLKGL